MLGFQGVASQLGRAFHRFLQSRNSVSLAIEGAILLGYLYLKAAAFWGLEPRTFPDSYGYTGMASIAVREASFVAGARPPTVPLFYKILGAELDAIVGFQLALSVICWVALAAVASNALQTRWFRPIAFGLILMFSLSYQILVWDGVILAESISFSLFALLVGCSVWLLRGWRWYRGLTFVVVGLLWAFSRDTNAYMLLMVAALFLGIAVFKKTYRNPTIIASVLVLIFVASSISSDIGKRWVFPVLNVIAQRILPDEERVAYFVDQGMPLSPTLMRLSGQWASSEDRAFYNAPELGEFRLWLSQRGRSSYVQFLMIHPVSSLTEPLHHMDELFFFNALGYSPRVRNAPFVPPLSSLAEALIFPKRPELILPMMVVAVVLATLAGLRGQARAEWLVPITLLVLAYPLAVVVWHGDAMEVGRHALPGSLQLRLGAWLLLLFAIDGVLVALISAERWYRISVDGLLRLREHKGPLSIGLGLLAIAMMILAIGADVILNKSEPGFGFAQVALLAAGVGALAASVALRSNGS